MVALWSVFFNVVLIGAVFGTKIGFALVRKFYIRLTWKWDKNQPILWLNNKNHLKQKVAKIDDDESFSFKKKKYAQNPKTQVIFEGIPHQVIAEGVAEPIDINEKTSDRMSTAMLERIILNSNMEDILGKVKQWVIYGLIGFAIAGLLMGASLYFNWQIWDVIVEKGTGSVATYLQPN